MFWKMGFNTPSTIEMILERDDFTLEDLLNDDELLQDLRNQNKRLTEYLSQPETIKTLLSYIVDGTESDDLLEKFKYPNVAAEVLTCECWPIMDAISQPEALEYLWKVLDKPAPLNPLLASFFSKVVQTLLQKASEPLTAYLLETPTLLFKLISHLATPAIMDVLLKMTSFDSEGDMPKNLTQFWSENQQLVKRLIGLFNAAESGASDAILGNAAILLGDLVEAGRKEAIEMQEFSTPSPFLVQLTSTPILVELLDNVFLEDEENRSAAALEYVLDFFSKLLCETERGEEEAPPTEIDRQRFELEVKRVLEAVVPRIKDLNSLLLEAPPSLTTASGELAVVCGNTRLQVAAVFAALLRNPAQEVEEVVIESKTLNVLLDMMRDLPHNNLFHACIAEIVDAAIGAPTDGPGSLLRKHMFTDCRLPHRLVEMVDASFEYKAKTKAHYGAYGYLTKMGNAVHAACSTPDKTRDPLSTYLNDDEKQVTAWKEHVEKRLLPENQKMHEGLEKPADGGDYTSGDEGDDWGNEAELAFTRYLNERINLGFPDFYDVGDDSDDSDEGSYGVTGVYSASFANYNTDMAGGNGDGYSMDHPTPAELKELSKNFRPPPLGTGIVEGEDPFGGPADQSTPLEGGDDTWAAFSAEDGAAANAEGAPAKELDLELSESTEVEDSDIPSGSVDIEGGGALFQSAA
mmetsp:Transcript_3596/g.8907  ORF Transcript_3596/g.8907 Transcript_3596/m.8907 type:complete len:690 (-) Transcript_3596:1282-3351(-)|eukprot:CAMPEP_0182925876 /NCGR_PEP_ID=MMETSP0105_2-20130417/10709_1 /TAXON_ID=81532 ORGANISM="Acanthoeca-like sp., Strain 10tr" /NCGR_SAMPLE_ID=MMETSP0105_2 /ASSEMBLY_ACC=CAM_ASM_000205 /LENGTH=689 /DNA_ID=CAMNT_0025063745 /DNA_START=257 /DNA_END=2326 /DNA_ORIENTATION=+